MKWYKHDFSHNKDKIQQMTHTNNKKLTKFETKFMQKLKGLLAEQREVKQFSQKLNSTRAEQTPLRDLTCAVQVCLNKTDQSPAPLRA